MVTNKEYSWTFNRVNSKGEKIFRHDTNQTLEEVTDYLEDNDIEYEPKPKGRMIWIYNDLDEQFAYYYTTGRWAPFIEGRHHPSKHYSSKGIEDFVNRFLNAKREFKNETTTRSK